MSCGAPRKRLCHFPLILCRPRITLQWNFAKFLVGSDGTVLERYAPTTSPESISDDIEAALKGEKKGVVAATSPIASALNLFK